MNKFLRSTNYNNNNDNTSFFYVSNIVCIFVNVLCFNLTRELKADNCYISIRDNKRFRFSIAAFFILCVCNFPKHDMKIMHSLCVPLRLFY